MSESNELVIDVVSDVVCPWCFVGKRRLDQALARLPDVRAAVRWHPFELNPDLPREGIDRRQYLEAKFGAPERADAIYQRVRSAGATVGIDFAFDRIVRQPNTRVAHRLIDWAQRQRDVDTDSEEIAANVTRLVERLFNAYFCEGRSLVGVAALADLAAEAGFDQGAVLAYLESDAGTQELIEAERRAHAIGVTGVPFLIFNRHFAVSGAQDPEVLLQAIARARASSPVVA
jgi:predicted DsbA family dithiol-disulfide isomerase